MTTKKSSKEVKKKTPKKAHTTEDVAQNLQLLSAKIVRMRRNFSAGLFILFLAVALVAFGTSLNAYSEKVIMENQIGELRNEVNGLNAQLVPLKNITQAIAEHYPSFVQATYNAITEIATIQQMHSEILFGNQTNATQ